VDRNLKGGAPVGQDPSKRRHSATVKTISKLTSKHIAHITSHKINLGTRLQKQAGVGSDSKILPKVLGRHLGIGQIVGGRIRSFNIKLEPLKGFGDLDLHHHAVVGAVGFCESQSGVVSELGFEFCSCVFGFVSSLEGGGEFLHEEGKEKSGEERRKEKKGERKRKEKGERRKEKIAEQSRAEQSRAEQKRGEERRAEERVI